VRAHDPNKPNRRADAAQHRRFFDLHPIRQRGRRFGLSRRGLRHDHLAAATLMFEARRDIHSGAEIVEHVARRDRDARSGMKSELQHDGRRARVSASGRVEARDIVLDRERRTDRVIGTGEGGHDRIAHGLDDKATIALHPVWRLREPSKPSSRLSANSSTPTPRKNAQTTSQTQDTAEPNFIPL
jgi:hypothetical protein